MTKQTTAPATEPTVGRAIARTDELLFGQDHPTIAGANVRQHVRQEGIEQLQASIEADGILQPLLVWEGGPSEFYVVDGSRRLAALRNLLAKYLDDPAGERQRFEECPVLLIEGGTVEDAMAKSLAANIMQLPLHPVDRYRAFQNMLDGMDEGIQREHGVAIIANRFGATTAAVERSLALGNLAEPILTGWLAGEIGLEEARAFTMERDQARQAEIYAKLKKKNSLRDWAIRNAIHGGENVSHLLAFVGAEAYEAAGGAIVRDLFREDDKGTAVSDIKLLKHLARGAVEDKRQALMNAGWSWVEPVEEMPSDWTWKYPRDQLAAKGATDAQKAASGAVISIDHTGKLSIEYGVRKPGVRAAKAPESKGTAAGKADKAKAPEISQKMREILDATATRAIGAALKLEPGIALVAILAGVASRGMGPMSIKADGPAARDADTETDFAQAFDLILSSHRKGNEIAVGQVAALAIQLGGGADKGPFDDEDAARLVAALSPPGVNKALRGAFNREEYFGGVSKHFALQALTDCGTPKDILHDLQNRRTSDVADFAVCNVSADWLPPELRAPGYDGPGAKGKAKR